MALEVGAEVQERLGEQVLRFHARQVLRPLGGDRRSYEVEFFAPLAGFVLAPSREHLTSAAWRRTIGPRSAPVRRSGLPTAEQIREVPKVAFYLMRFSYTPETWSKLIQNPEDRRDAARAYIEEVGGSLHGFWYGFGQYDGYAIFEAPDNVSVAGVVLAITAGGALASVETTVLMSVEEMLEALAKGKDIGYRRPGE